MDALFAHKRAMVHQQVQESAHANALTAFDKIVRRNPMFAAGWYEQATLHVLLDESRRAFDWLRRAVEVNPNLDCPAQAIALIEQRLRGDLEETS